MPEIGEEAQVGQRMPAQVAHDLFGAGTVQCQSVDLLNAICVLLAFGNVIISNAAPLVL